MGNTRTNGLVTQVAFSPDGASVAAGVDVDPDVGNLMTLNAATAAPERTFPVHAGIYGVAWVKGQRVAATSGSGPLVWDPTRGGITRPIPGDGNTMALASSPDGTILALVNTTGSLELWNTMKWTQLESSGTAGGGHDVAFTRDGQTIAVGSSTGDVQMWNVRSAQELGAVFRVPQRISDNQPA